MLFFNVGYNKTYWSNSGKVLKVAQRCICLYIVTITLTIHIYVDILFRFVWHVVEKNGIQRCYRMLTLNVTDCCHCGVHKYRNQRLHPVLQGIFSSVEVVMTTNIFSTSKVWLYLHESLLYKFLPKICNSHASCIFSYQGQLLHSCFLSVCPPGQFYFIRFISESVRVRKLKIGENDGSAADVFQDGLVEKHGWITARSRIFQ